jgi:hypothetical protein
MLSKADVERIRRQIVEGPSLPPDRVPTVIFERENALGILETALALYQRLAERNREMEQLECWVRSMAEHDGVPIPPDCWEWLHSAEPGKGGVMNEDWTHVWRRAMKGGRSKHEFGVALDVDPPTAAALASLQECLAECERRERENWDAAGQWQLKAEQLFTENRALHRLAKSVVAVVPHIRNAEECDDLALGWQTDLENIFSLTTAEVDREDLGRE